MTTQYNTWAPILKENENPTLSLLVRCGETEPDEETYKHQLHVAIQSLIKESPKQARRDIEEVSDPDSPGLSFILAEFQPQEWAAQIMLSPQMQMLLTRIDWQKTNPVKKRSEETLPSLQDILQMLP